MYARPERMVLLALHGDHVDQQALSSATGLCKRLDAGLEILVVAPDNNLRHAIQQLMKAPDREPLYWSLSPKPMLRRRDIVDYANTHENIVAVVIDSLEHWDGRAQDRSSNPWQRLRCPLVTATHSE